MEDFKILFWIVIGVIYLARFVLKKGKKTQKPISTSQQPSQQGRGQQPLTFEELLKEFSEKKQQNQPVDATEETKTISLPKRPRSPQIIDDEQVRSTYQASITAASQRKLSSQQELPDLEHFDSYEMEERKTGAVNLDGLLSSPEELKNAIILTEILNRKY